MLLRIVKNLIKRVNEQLTMIKYWRKLINDESVIKDGLTVIIIIYYEYCWLEMQGQR